MADGAGSGGGLDDLVKEFLVESNENLDRLDSELVKLESDPRSKELLASIFRTIHSIKGACGFLGFEKLQGLAHAGENLLSKLRDGKLELTAEMGSALLAAVDGIRRMLGEIAASGQDGNDDYAETIARLKQLQETDPAPVATAEAPAAPAPGKPGRKKKFEPMGGRLGGMLVERKRVKSEDLARALTEQENGDGRPLGEILVSLGLASATDIQE